MIALEHVTKRFGPRRVLSDVSFVARPGEVVGLVGPNGAGKSTALRLLAGVLVPDQGRALVGGHDLATERRTALAQLGYLAEAVPLYPDMRVVEYLEFRARLKGVARRERAACVDQAVAQARVGEVRRMLIGRLSRGFRQRVGLADVLVARPPVLLLDEPTAGLDPVEVREVRDLLAGLGGDHTVLLSSHVLAELEQVATRFVILLAGQVAAAGTASELRALVGLGDDATLEQVFFALSDRAATAAAGGA